MKLLVPIVVFLATSVFQEVTSQHALFVKNDVLRRGKSRVTRQTNADQMVQNILQWLQGVYTQNSRRSRFSSFDSFYKDTNFDYDDDFSAFRQGTLREYLPPSNTQKPRPFEPVSTTLNGQNGYPPSGITPQPPFPFPDVTGSGYPSPPNEITPPQTGYPTGYPSGRPSTVPPTISPPGYTTGPTESPQQPSTTGYPSQPGFSTQEPSYTNGQPSQQPGFSTVPPTGYTYGTPKPGFPTESPVGPAVTTGQPEYTTQPPQGFTTGKPGFATGPPPGFSTGYPTVGPSESTGYPPASTETGQGFSTSSPSDVSTGYTVPGSSETPAFPTHAPTAEYSTSSPLVPSETPGPTEGPSIVTHGPSTHFPSQGGSTISPQTTPEEFTSAIETTPGSVPSVPSETTISPELNTIPTGKTPEPGDGTSTGTETDEDLKHPPHIHDINVECGKEMMTINIEFNRQFDGIIYSKGFYNNPECRYVQENSGQTKYSFTVNLNTCGTEFVNAFDTEGKSYLQNVLVIQNEAGIQEVWDVIRSVRCLWEGNLKDTLSVALSVGMLTQEIVTFSGDTAMAKLDIQLGKGPFAPPADGLVKIGETMTLVVSVSGDPGFDLQVKDCRATDSSSENVVPLTDDNGCVLKPKLFGAFQKTRNTGSTGASIIAYAFFNAFKFPDVMDLMIECNIELCKTDCEVCPDPNQKTEPGRRRRRDLASFNATLADGVTMGKHIRVILPEDLSDGKTIINLSQNDDGVCMSTQNFVFSSALLISLLASSCFFSAYLWLQNQRLSFKH